MCRQQIPAILQNEEKHFWFNVCHLFVLLLDDSGEKELYVVATKILAEMKNSSDLQSNVHLTMIHASLKISFCYY